MPTHEKIKQLIIKKGVPLTAIHRKIKALFQEHAIAYQTLYRTVHGLTEVRDATLTQIAQALGTTPEAIKENPPALSSPAHTLYNDKARFEKHQHHLPFSTGRLILNAGAVTPTEKTLPENQPSVTWIYGLQGEITCIIDMPEGNREVLISKNTSFGFESTRPHRFENRCGRKSSCILVQNNPAIRHTSG